MQGVNKLAGVDVDVPRLIGNTGRELYHDARAHIKAHNGTALEKAQLFEEFIKQIEERTSRAWWAEKHYSTDGSFIFLGRAADAFIIDKDGKIFQGKFQEGALQLAGVHQDGKPIYTPRYDRMREI